MYKYMTYEQWITEQKVISFVDFLIDQEQNGSSIPITFEKFLEIPCELFEIYFNEKYIFEFIISNFENYRDFINRVEFQFSIRKK